MYLKTAHLLTTLHLVFVSMASYAQAQNVVYDKPKVISFAIPAVFIGYGLISLIGKNEVRSLDLTTRSELQEDHPLFAAHIDDYMQFAPAAAVYALNLAGINSKHSLADATACFVLSEAIMGGAVHGLKMVSHRLRPNGSSYNSFPSGHTANAFVAAEFLSQEYKDSSPWYGYAGYTVAAGTGILRMYNNKHWFSDVVAGAGFGILSAKLSCLAYPRLKRLISGCHTANYNLVPLYQAHELGLSFNASF